MSSVIDGGIVVGDQGIVDPRGTASRQGGPWEGPGEFSVQTSSRHGPVSVCRDRPPVHCRERCS